MKNKSIIFAVLLITLTIGLGCGISDKVQKAVNGTNNANAANADNKTIAEKAVDTAFGEEKIGVQECDELYDYIAGLITKSENEDYLARAARQYFLNRIREQIKATVEQNKNDKAQMAKDCKEYRRRIDSFINQQSSNQK